MKDIWWVKIKKKEKMGFVDLEPVEHTILNFDFYIGHNVIIQT